MSESPKSAKRRRVRRTMPAGMVKRGRTYYCNFMRDGRRIRKRLSADFNAAVTMLNELRSRADRGALELLDNKYAWEDLKKDFLAWAKQSTRSGDKYAADLEAFERFARVRCVSMVTPRLVDQWRQSRLTEGVRPRTINRQVGTIRNMLSKGVHRFKVLASNALADVKRLPEGDPSKVRRALTADEVDSLFKHSMPYMVPVWRLYATTGIRRNELVDLLWSDVDFGDRSITVRASVAKAKRARRVLLDDAMVVMLAKLRDEAEQRLKGWDRDHVFVNQEGRPHKHNLLRKFYGTCKRAGIKDGKRNGSVDLHSLRVTFTTLSLEGGASPKAVQTILGHATLDMTMRVYAKATDRSMRDAINALPFASASAPDHVLTITGDEPVNGQDLTQIYPKKAKRVMA